MAATISGSVQFLEKRPTFDRRNPKGLLNFPNGKITVSHCGTGIRIINVIVADCLCIEEYGERNLFGAIVCEVVDCFDHAFRVRFQNGGRHL